MRLLKKTLIWSSIVFFFTTGFRFFPGGNAWSINSSTATASKIFVRFADTSHAVVNDMPAGDPLATDTAPLTVAETLAAIFTDYTNVAGAFVTLVASTDGDFAANSTDRIIDLEVGNPPGGADGYATQKWSGTTVVGCTIVFKEALFESAKNFTAILTHEIGHCLGLDHAQDTTRAIMSYYHDSEMLRLQIDDKMGLVYLYPQDSSKAHEDQTLGLSCSRR